MSRRRVLVLCIALAGAACGDQGGLGTTTAPALQETPTSSPDSSLPAETTSTPTSTFPIVAGPGHGGTVIIGDDQEPPTLNPYAEGGDNFIVWIVGQALHTGAWDIEAATLERIPEVVTELPTVANGGIAVSDDGTMTVRYVIRDEAMWADGTPISGDDFAFTYEMVSAPGIIGSQFGKYEDYALIDPASIDAGAKTFAFTMAQPSLAHEELFRWLIPAHQVAGSDVLADWNDEPWVSGGPFIFDGWERGERLTLVRNDNYWKSDPESGGALPYLDAVVFEFVPETERLLQSFAARELDVINPPPAPTEIDRVLGPAIAEGAEVTIHNGVVWEHLNFQFGVRNRNEDSLNRYVDFRRAVAHAIDREALTAEATRGYGQPLGSFLDVFLPDLATGAWEHYDYDPGEARRLLGSLCDELGRNCVAEPPRLVFSTTSNAEMRPRIAEWLVTALGDVGIEVELDLEDSQLFFGQTLDTGDWDVGLWAWVGGPGYRHAVSILDVFDPNGPPPQGSNYSRWGTPAVSGAEPIEGGPDGAYDVNQGPSTVTDEHTARFADVLAAARSTVDDVQLDRLLVEAEQILADQVVIIPLFPRLVASAVWTDEIAGFETNPTIAGHTWNIERWYRVDL